MKQVLETPSVAMLHSEVQRGWCLIGARIEGVGWFPGTPWNKRGSGYGLLVFKMHDKIEIHVQRLHALP